jgi:hypothetical protein
LTNKKSPNASSRCSFLNFVVLSSISYRLGISIIKEIISLKYRLVPILITADCSSWYIFFSFCMFVFFWFRTLGSSLLLLFGYKNTAHYRNGGIKCNESGN